MTLFDSYKKSRETILIAMKIFSSEQKREILNHSRLPLNKEIGNLVPITQ